MANPRSGQSNKYVPAGSRAFMVPLPEDVYQALRDEAHELSKSGTKVHMTEIARSAITKRLRSRLKTNAQQEAAAA